MPIFSDLVAATPLSSDQAMRTAIAAAERVRGTTSPNPPVGCVILDANGMPVAVAGTDPVGGPHAEAQALDVAGEAARGGTAVVTLEPCHHHGRTGPCTGVLHDAGIAKVVYAVADPNPVAAGGADWLDARGTTIERGTLRDEVADGVLRPWLHWQATRRPHITLKTAGTLDGLAAATDGSSQWITGEAARRRVHVDRSRRDAVIVGTGTVLADDPRLTARRSDGELHAHQPLRVAVGRKEIPADAAIRGGFLPGERVDPDVAASDMFRHVQTRDMSIVVDVLADLGIIDVLVEGGPRLAGAFLEAGLVDAVESYVAPGLLGAGTAVVDVA
ncbi:bifunctional diaminohydroxyphosphoribosylaminopyrimidine deaminase/5-amino-6-(5-phosphoribosylamino)uracil reductase RibD, partial [uncultured Corynebacterium sp.]|uniref:bifunctional diaminohydroxyphosphoribosylaminopyrimidine deaminase/5-amino-6-(5-phosphoribosylamino)uracil reductase RibD n=1 Tax=uncultured Corynebacterium sp. TaxID=159447 RepID=UPI0025EA58EC